MQNLHALPLVCYTSDCVSNIGSTKPYSLTFEQRRDYLYAYVSGDKDSYDISRAFWQEIADEARRVNATSVLVVEDIVENVSLAEVFQIAAELPRIGFGSRRVAFVDRYLSQNEVNEFGALVAQNRGLDGEVFNSIEEAERWMATN